jgi:hypothetical protein
MIGAGASIAGRKRRPGWVANFTSLVQGSPAPGNITWHRSGSNATVQTGVNSVSLPVAADTMRVRYNGRAVIEPQRLNWLANPRDLSQADWTNNAGSVDILELSPPNHYVGPDGLEKATRVKVTAGHFGSVNARASLTSKSYVLTFWVKSPSGSVLAYSVNFQDVGLTNHLVSGASSVDWAVVESLMTTASNSTQLAYFIGEGRLGGTPYDSLYDMPQIEQALYPTSFVSGTRSPDLPTVAGTELVTNGGMRFQAVFDPIGASTELESGIDLPLVGFDANNRIKVNRSTWKLQLTLEGTLVIFDNAIPAFARRSPNMEIYVESGGGMRAHAWCVVVGAVVDLGSATLQKNWDPSQTYQLLNDGTNVFPAEVSQLAVYV